jgi:hypothetical protein
VFLEKNEDAFVGATFSTRTPGSWKLQKHTDSKCPSAFGYLFRLVDLVRY